VDTGDSHCEIYNATADSWSAAGSMTMERVSHTATVLADGRVLLTGGSRLRQDQAFRVASAELYDPATGIFTATGSMAFRRQFHDAVMLADGRVLITGGLDQNSEPVLTAEIYDPDTGTFSPAGNMVAGRNRHSTVRLADGRVLITGGQSSGTAAEIYRPCCVSP